MSWTDYEDVAARWLGSTMEANETQVTTLISDAEDIILSYAPDVQDRIDDETLRLETVKRVVVRMVERKLRNPTGHRSVTTTAGPSQQSITFGGNEPGALFLTAEDKKDIGNPKTNGGAFGLDMTPVGAPTYYTNIDENMWRPLR